MKIVIAALALFSSFAWGSASVMEFAVCPPSGPPALAATGTSPDGAMCLNQQMRDSRGTVFQAVVAPIGYAQHYCVTMTGPLSPAGGGRCITGISAGKMDGGIFKWQNAGSPAWGYWDYEHKTVWTFGQAFPPAQPPQTCPAGGCTGG